MEEQHRPDEMAAVLERPEFALQNPHDGKREPAPKAVLCHMCPHTYKNQQTGFQFNY